MIGAGGGGSESGLKFTPPIRALSTVIFIGKVWKSSVWGCSSPRVNCVCIVMIAVGRCAVCCDITRAQVGCDRPVCLVSMQLHVHKSVVIGQCVSCPCSLLVCLVNQLQ